MENISWHRCSYSRTLIIDRRRVDFSVDETGQMVKPALSVDTPAKFCTQQDKIMSDEGCLLDMKNAAQNKIDGRVANRIAQVIVDSFEGRSI